MTITQQQKQKQKQRQRREIAIIMQSEFIEQQGKNATFYMAKIKDVTNYDEDDVKPTSDYFPVFYFGNHPPEVEIGEMYVTDVVINFKKNHDLYYVVHNDPDKQGPSRFEKILSNDSDESDNGEPNTINVIDQFKETPTIQNLIAVVRHSRSKHGVEVKDIPKLGLSGYILQYEPNLVDTMKSISTDNVQNFIDELIDEHGEHNDMSNLIFDFGMYLKNIKREKEIIPETENEEKQQLSDNEVKNKIENHNKKVEQEYQSDIQKIDGVGPIVDDTLQDVGFRTIQQIAETDIEVLTDLDGIGEKTAEKIIHSAKKLSGLQDEEQENKSLETENDLINELKQKMLEYLGDDAMSYTPPYKSYRASSAKGCVRKILFGKWQRDLTILEKKSVEKAVRENTIDQDKLGASQFGTVIHNMVESALKDMDAEILVDSEQLVKIDLDDIQIMGHYDLLVKLDDGNDYVVDIKTHFQPVEFKDSDPLSIEGYLRQLNIYQHALGKIGGFLFYVDRNDFSVKVYYHDYDEELFNKTVDHFRRVSELEESHKLPMIDPKYTPDSYPCSWNSKWSGNKGKCKFWYICYDDPNNHSLDEFEEVLN